MGIIKSSDLKKDIFYLLPSYFNKALSMGVNRYMLAFDGKITLSLTQEQISIFIQRSR